MTAPGRPGGPSPERAGSGPSRPGSGRPGSGRPSSDSAGPNDASSDGAGSDGSGPGRAGQQPPRPDQQPSWAEVIGNTVRLWTQRHLSRRGQACPGAPRQTARRPGTQPQAARLPGAPPPAARRSRIRRRAAVTGAVVIVLAAGGLTFALVPGSPALPRPAASQTARSAASQTARPAAGQTPRTAPSPARTPVLSPRDLAAAQANGTAAAAWVAAEVSHDAIASCDPVTCTALQAAGFPDANLLPLGAESDPAGSAIVVSTPAVRNQLGARLPGVYAPAVLATFGTGDARVDVRAVAPRGGRAYLAAQRADLLARQKFGLQLLHNRAVHLPAAAAAQVSAGNLDSRLLLTLAGLAAQAHRVNVLAVGDSGPGASPGVPLRVATVSALVEPGHPRKNAGYLRAVLAILKAQRAPFQCSYSTLRQGRATVIRIAFAAPGPLGLLAGL